VFYKFYLSVNTRVTAMYKSIPLLGVPLGIQSMIASRQAECASSAQEEAAAEI